MKMTLSLANRILPANMNFNKINKKIPAHTFNLEVNSKHHQLPNPENSLEKPIFVGVNSFGMGGSNCHIVMQDYVSQLLPSSSNNNNNNEEKEKSKDKVFILPISAKNPEALKQLAKSYLEFISKDQQQLGLQVTLEDICFTASARRTHYNERLTICFRNKEELKVQLESFISEENKEDQNNQQK